LFDLALCASVSFLFIIAETFSRELYGKVHTQDVAVVNNSDKNCHWIKFLILVSSFQCFLELFSYIIDFLISRTPKTGTPKVTQRNSTWKKWFFEKWRKSVWGLCLIPKLSFILNSLHFEAYLFCQFFRIYVWLISLPKMAILIDYSSCKALDSKRSFLV